MNRKEINYFRGLLNVELELLLERAGTTVSTLLNGETNASDPLDLATIETAHSTLLRIRDRESKLIPKIQHALERIHDGTFGICDVCGGQIGIARLMARPVATLCIRCKTQMETGEKLYGRTHLSEDSNQWERHFNQ